MIILVLFYYRNKENPERSVPMEADLLKSANMKSTKKRRLILSILEEKQGAMTADEIYDKTRHQLPMSASTIYRALNIMAENHLIVKNHCQDGKIYFQLNRHTHQHQLVCSICKEVVPIDECPLDELEKKLMDKTGYTITGHFLEFTGICPHCLSTEKKSSQIPKTS